MTTAERLARALRAAGEPALARRAEKLEFDCSPQGDTRPMKKLIMVLRAAKVTNRKLAPLYLEVMRGRYYNTQKGKS